MIRLQLFDGHPLEADPVDEAGEQFQHTGFPLAGGVPQAGEKKQDGKYLEDDEFRFWHE